jgi:hypothetical protein
MPAAGSIIRVGSIPGELIGYTETTSDQGTITTTETTVMSLEVPLVAGRTYWIDVDFHAASSVGTDTASARIREDSSTGSERQSFFCHDLSNTTGGNNVTMRARYPATATANKTFVCTLVRSSGSGNVRLEAASNRPAYMVVTYALT